MNGYYDHQSGLVPKPTIVHDKNKVYDPHDNPSILIDREGHIWTYKTISHDSRKNHNYIRRPLNACALFEYFWTDGNLSEFTRSSMYLGNMEGEVWQLLYEMKSDLERPVQLYEQ